jgi:hypothetical protein
MRRRSPTNPLQPPADPGGSAIVWKSLRITGPPKPHLLRNHRSMRIRGAGVHHRQRPWRRLPGLPRHHRVPHQPGRPPQASQHTQPLPAGIPARRRRQPAQPEGLPVLLAFRSWSTRPRVTSHPAPGAQHRLLGDRTHHRPALRGGLRPDRHLAVASARPGPPPGPAHRRRLPRPCRRRRDRQPPSHRQLIAHRHLAGHAASSPRHRVSPVSDRNAG